LFRAVVVAAGVAALLLPGEALALDHVSIQTHDVKLPAAHLLPACRKSHKSTKAHPCRARGSHSMSAGTPDAGWTFGLALNPDTTGGWVLSVRLTRTDGNSMERHVFNFQLAASSVTVAPDLSAATLDTGTQLGQFGAMKLTFGKAGALASATPAAGCTTGTWQMRTGVMTGNVRFAADSTYFRTILETSLPTDVSANTGETPTCATPPVPCGHGSSVSVQTSSTGPFLYAQLHDGALMFLEFLTQMVGPAQISHSLTESGLPASDLTAATDLSSATVATTAAKRFTGSLSFTAGGPPSTGPYPACGAGATFGVAKGTTTGGITGHFAAIPAPQPALGPSFLSSQ
jgi:hypothetical protein